jgi:hypothetical protein
MEDKPKTLIERFGFKDEQLTTPEHDKILLWLLDKRNMVKVLEELGVIRRDKVIFICPYNKAICDWDREKGECSAVCTHLRRDSRERIERMTNVRNVFMREKDNPRIEMEIHAEYPIVNRGYTIGFVDLFVFIEDEVEVDGFLFNYYDVKNNRVFLEIKPLIDSVGELIRQINFYRSYLEGVWIVVTKTQGLKEILSSQGILVYEIKGDLYDRLSPKPNI